MFRWKNDKLLKSLSQTSDVRWCNVSSCNLAKWGNKWEFPEFLTVPLLTPVSVLLALSMSHSTKWGNSSLAENCHLMSSVLNLYQHSHHYLEEICNISNLTNKQQREGNWSNAIYSQSYFICLKSYQNTGYLYQNWNYKKTPCTFIVL